MSKHTPGPWICIDSIEGDHDFSIRSGSGDFENDDDCYYIADVHGGLDGAEKANASLITAAPELLSACKAALRILSLWGPNDCDPSSHLFEENRALAMMQNAFELAIAKAEATT